MKVPSGKKVLVGNRLYKAGADLPDKIAAKLGLGGESKPKAKKEKAVESPSTSGSGSGSNA